MYAGVCGLGVGDAETATTNARDSEATKPLIMQRVFPR